MGKPLIMGRKTFESIGRPLPGRTNIVLSRDPSFHAAGVDIADCFSAAMAAAETAARGTGATEIMVIGGSGIYELAFPHADRIYLTEVHAEIDGDAVFPAFDRTYWIERSRSYQAAAPNETADYSFVVLDRVAAADR